ncbi:hypothetical protein SADUNF_Sadunf16G0181700 [Salix dunnii]|uniref:Reticulon-like protein n=1 Tax=Salix dunnii TaxID=1413687 RepID=A0A835J9F8_9ROSI|nr:hypothetical protein SADUNF_Sadunf16G0181700 [Salix dunnii]
MSTGGPKDGELQVVVAPEKKKPALPPLPLAARAGSTALVEYTAPVLKEDEEDLELKLRRILENVPVRVSNTSGSSAGSGSGDFHQYRQMRRREQDRLARMDADYQRRKEIAEFNMRREERMKAAEEQTEKKRQPDGLILFVVLYHQSASFPSHFLYQSSHRSISEFASSKPDQQWANPSPLVASPSIELLEAAQRWCASVGVLVSATTLWILFEKAGYNLLSFVANVLFLLVVILFFWAKSASLLNRPLPPLPNLEIPEEIVAKAGGIIHLYANYALLIAREIVIDKNLKVFLQVVSGLCVASYIGSLCNFLTLVYIGVLLSLSVPLVYDKYQHHIDEKFCLAHKIIQEQYKKIDDAVLKKIPLPSYKEKKTQ